jgi:GT2 family glycosyltransferase
MDLSAIVVSWNTRDLLRCCLESLRRVRASLAAEGREAEIIVVDNASGDDSASMVRTEFPEVVVIANSWNRNYAAASNQALEISQGDYLLLANPDTVIPERAVPELIGFLEERPGAGAVAPRLLHPDGRAQASVRGFPTPAALFGEITGLAKLLPRSAWGGYRWRADSVAKAHEVDQPMASCLLIRRAALDAAGGFDEQFPLFFNDVDLCFRLRSAGWSIWYDPRVRVTHHGGASTRQVRPRAVWQSHLGLVRFYQKHYRRQLGWPAFAAARAAILGTGVLRAGWAWLTRLVGW